MVDVGDVTPRARPGGYFPSLRREWAIHYQWHDLPLVEGRGALERGQAGGEG